MSTFDQHEASAIVALQELLAGRHPPPETLDHLAGDVKTCVDALIEALQADGVQAVRRTFSQLVEDRRPWLGKLVAQQPPTPQADSAPQEEPQADTRVKMGARGKEVFRTLSMDEIDALPDIEYLVQSVLPRCAVSLVFGESNTGKTFFALHLALCVAYGMSWIGRSVKQGRVLYIYAEGDIGLKQRLQAWRKYYSKPSTTAIDFIPFPVHLLHEQEIFMATIAQYEPTYALVVIDPYSMCAIGTNQNDQKEVTQILGVAHQIRQAYACHVLIVHHTNKQDGYNGAASFKNHVDTMLKLSCTDNQAPVVMHYEKHRDGRKREDLALLLQEVELYLDASTLEMVTSCVIDAAPGGTFSPSKPQEEVERERTIMLGILQQHHRLSTSKWKQLSLEAGVPKSSHYAHIEYLKQQQLVTWINKGAGKAVEFMAKSEAQEAISSQEEETS
ncbi:MAG TPA: AAA family ATPase [Ktedonobacteraceae bacterium]|nr:AAA family ATPase [Ktedonobacteraceae bacterium]